MNVVDTEETGRCRFCAQPRKRLFDILADGDNAYVIVKGLCRRCVDIMMPKEGAE